MGITCWSCYFQCLILFVIVLEPQIDQQTGQGRVQSAQQVGPPCKLKLSRIQGNIRVVSGNPDVEQPGRQENQGMAN